ncbi:Uncharacterised protein [Mycobacteroides abscessus subsp. abscessus]|nr:Uncharacterised protein [Mycobacteroides abscessus subsp. abscessus]
MAFGGIEADEGVNVGDRTGLHFDDLDKTGFHRARCNASSFEVFGEIAS